MAISRRNLIKAAGAGGALAALSGVGPGLAVTSAQQQPAPEEFVIGPGGRKPVPVAPPGNMDPAVHSKNDVLFWSEQMMEHAVFIAMLTPGAELAGLRRQALDFRTGFQEHIETVGAATIDETNFRDLNRRTTDLTLPLIALKRELEDAQRNARIHSLVWPTFAAHIATEGERFVQRLNALSVREVEFDLGELVQFWTRIMGEHALFAAHLLDPTEAALIDQARTAAQNFQQLGVTGVMNLPALFAAVDQIIAFKETAETGIQTGQIQSIIHPVLADHIRREAVKFQDELARTVGVEVAGAQAAPAQIPSRP